MDPKKGQGPAKARTKFPEIVELGGQAGAGGPGAVAEAELAKARHAADLQARNWRSSKASERFKVDSAAWLKSLILLTRSEPSLENWVCLLAAAYDWREGHSFAGLAASAWAFTVFLDGEVGKKLTRACIEDESQRGIVLNRYQRLAKDLQSNLDSGQLRPKADEAALVDESLVAAEQLEERLNALLPPQRIDDGEPSLEGKHPEFSGIASFLLKIRERLQTRGNESEAAELAHELQAATPPPTQLPAGSGQEWRSWVMRVAAELRVQQRQNPFAYTVVRTALWTEQMGRPLRVTGPTGEELKQLESLLRDGQAAQGLELCEKLLPQHPLSLDLSYFCARALEMLDCPAARSAVGYLTFILLEQYPALLTQRDASAPELRDYTKGWLQQEQIRWAMQAGDARVALPPDDLIGALTLLQRSMMQTRSRSRHFQLRLDMVRYCLDQGRANLATPILELLTQEAEFFRLAEWDPELLTTLLLLEERAAMLAQADPTIVQRRVRARLCQLDPVLVAKLDAAQ